ncbi:RNA polymerase sigma factor [Polyangium aurulentum]|uniref:RNA polymerase sigma factor n=1 Tax=Polyangium aurulentum TaxID=2567896 RepID=UPI0020104438|nr:sigma-70 family RNA polymerase sigma factor [Polyangium aurulentum]UQA61361.1 sigma-70 family RNA polymerase sigma factor [Polyangium aurulentum]
MAEQNRPPPPSDKFTAFCVKYISTVTSRLQQIGVRKADIKDVTQRVFLKVHKYFDQVPAEGVEAWLFMICEQQAAEHYRPLYQRLERPEPANYPMPDEDDAYERLELAQFVGQALKEMDPELADILVRHEVDEQSLPVIAKELGVSRNTAQARLAEAKKSLKNKMVKLLQPITPRNRRRLMLLPFGLGAMFHNDEPLSAEFLEEVRRDVWQRLARELGLPEELPAAPPPPEPPPSEPPASGEPGVDATVELPRPSSRTLLDAAKPLLKRILTNPLFWAAPGIFGGYMLAKTMRRQVEVPAWHLGPVMTVVVDMRQVQGEGRGDGSTSPVRGSSVVVTPAAAVRAPARIVDADPERKSLERARQSLEQGRVAEALAALRQHERVYPESQYKAARDRYIAKAIVGVRQDEQKRAGAP